MDLEKLKLKELLKVTRENNLQDEAKAHMELKDLKYAKRKPLIDFLNTKKDVLNIVNNDDAIPEDAFISDYEEELPMPDLPDDLNDLIKDIPNVEQPQEQKKEHEEPIILDLSNIKNRAKKPKSIPQPPPKRETPEEKKEREQAIVLLNNYYNRFSWLNNEIIEAPNDDPILKLKIVKAKLSSRNMSNLFAEHFFSVCYGAECAIMSTPYVSDYVKLNGFTQNLRAYESTRDLLDELLIEYAPMIGENQQVSVEARLGMVMLAVGVQTHMNNTQLLEAQRSMIPPPPVQQIQQPKPDINKPIDPKFEVTDL